MTTTTAPVKKGDLIDFPNVESLGVPVGGSFNAREFCKQVGGGVLTATGWSPKWMHGLHPADAEPGDDAVGVYWPTGQPQQKLRIFVLLNVNDLYAVFRVRQISRGKDRGRFKIDFRADDIHVENISDMVWEASLTR